MQLLDSCPLPQAQFASLSLLLQVNLNDGDGEEGRPEKRLEKVSTEDAAEGAAGEADKSAGPPAKKALRHAVMKESLTVISPLTILPEDACDGSMESLHYKIMDDYGMRDDFAGAGVGAHSDDDSVGDVSDEENTDEDEEGEMPEDDNNTTRRSVRFHDDTKEGTAVQDPPATDAPSVSKDGNAFGGDPLLVKAYKPPRHHTNCGLGLTLFYVSLCVGDVSKYFSEGNESAGETSDAGARSLLKNCASVLLPGIPLSSLANSSNDVRRKQSGIVLLTIGITGPAYDLFGCSSVIATLPERLREGMATLAMVDTAPKVVKVERKNQLKQSLRQTGSSKKIKSKVGSVPQAAQADQPSTAVSYDSEYFRRLYMALLATLMDDEDGLMRDHDEILATMTGTNLGTSLQGRQSLTESTTGLLADQSITSSGTVKKKRFTFSRSKKNMKKSSMQGYELGEMISGGDDPFEARKSNLAFGSSGDSTGTDNAEIVRRTAQQLEVMSLVEDDMDLPSFDIGRGRGSGGRKVPSSPSSAKSPRKAVAGAASGRFGRLPVPSDLAGFEYRPPSQQQHHMHGGMSVSGTASTSVMGNSSDDVSLGTGGDDTATISSRFTIGSSLSSASSVPTLSKSKRDSSLSSTRKSSRSKFLQRKRKDKSAQSSSPATKGANPTIEEDAVMEASPAKPPLFPSQQLPPPQPVYDPFSMDDDVDIEQHDEYQEDDSKTEQSETATVASASTRDTKDSAQTPMTPKSIEGSVGSSAPGSVEPSSPATPKEVVSHDQELGAISRSFSEDASAEGVRSMPESVASVPESPAASPPEEEAAATMVEPKRHLDVGLALNEDLTCEYHRSKLSSLTVEGTVQVKVKTRYEEGEEPSLEQQQQPTIPFFLVFKDHSGHIKALQENKKFVENVTSFHEGDVQHREFTYTINVTREDEYFPVVRYKCGNSLRPVPIRVQSRVRTQGKFCRIALQISSNPQNPSDLVHLTIIMSVPEGVRGDSLQCNPPGGVWNETKRVVLWCVSELGGGEKFQLQSIFEMDDELLNSGEDLTEKLEFPVLARCQCSGAQLSDVALEVSDVSDLFPAEVSTNVVRRFRVSHKESNK